MKNNVAFAVFIASIFSAAESFQWISVPETEIGTFVLQEATTESFLIPNVIPDDARDVLVFASISSGHTSRVPYDNVKIYTLRGSRRYEQYLGLRTWDQNAVNTNSDNMWFPMP